MAEKHRFEHNDHTNLAFLLTSVALQALLLWLSYIVYETWVAAFGPGWRPLEWAFCLLAFTFISATLLAVRYRSWFVRWYYWFAAYWFACIGPLFGGSVLFVLLEDIGPHVGVSVVPNWAGIISFGVAIGVIIYGMWQSQRVEIVRTTITLPNLPKSWQGKAVVLVADLHLGNVRGVRFAEKVTRKIRTLAPEMVFIAGDLYDGLICDASKLIAPLKNLASPQGTYFVSGNHDYYSDSEHFFRAIQDAGIHILNNAVVTIDGLQIAGMDFNDTNYPENFKTVLKNIDLDTDKSSILLRHEPTHLEIASQKGFSLQVSGHTHRGQFWPLSLITRYLFKGYDYGLKQFEKMTVCTTSGVGTWGPPFRLGTKSEIVAITLT